jgi:hypothetical protein
VKKRFLVWLNNQVAAIIVISAKGRSPVSHNKPDRSAIRPIELARILHEGSDIRVDVASAAGAIARKSIAVAMV